MVREQKYTHKGNKCLSLEGLLFIPAQCGKSLLRCLWRAGLGASNSFIIQLFTWFVILRIFWSLWMYRVLPSVLWQCRLFLKQKLVFWEVPNWRAQLNCSHPPFYLQGPQNWWIQAPAKMSLTVKFLWNAILISSFLLYELLPPGTTVLLATVLTHQS